MRCNQVTISIERFGDSRPENYPAAAQRIQVYCDDYDSIYAALSKAYALVINELAEYENIGARTDVYTNEFSRVDYREMHGTLPNHKRKYEEDVNLQYIDSSKKMLQDIVWVYEHSNEILNAIKECEDTDSIVITLKERFGLNDYQIRKLAQMRMEMFTKEEYESAKHEIEEMEATLNKHELYQENKRKKLNKEIKKLEAYFVAAEHYEEIMKLLVEAEDSRGFEDIMKNKFGFTYQESDMIRYLNVNDFSKEKQKEELEWLKRSLKSYSEE